MTPAEMTPFKYAQRYWYLPVPIVGPNNELLRWEHVRIHRYRLASKQSGEVETWDSVTAGALAEYERVVRPFDADGKNDATEEVRVFIKKADGTVETLVFRPADKPQLLRTAKRAIWGKASPEEVQVTLQLAVRCGLVRPEQLQEYCSSGKIGLDCNGFVGNYLQHVLAMDVTPSQGMNSYFSKGREMRSLDDLDDVSIYILGLVDPTTKVLIDRLSNGRIAHIMITNPFGGMVGNSYIGRRGKKFYRRLRVVESAGRAGLIESDYLLLDGKEGVFNVYRQALRSKIPVRIRRVWI